MTSVIKVVGITRQSHSSYPILTGLIYVYSSRMLYVDGHPLPYAVNHTISYPSDNGRMPYLVQRLRAGDVNVERSISDDSIRYNITTAIDKGKNRFIMMTSILPSLICGLRSATGPHCRIPSFENKLLTTLKVN